MEFSNPSSLATLRKKEARGEERSTLLVVDYCHGGARRGFGNVSFGATCTLGGPPDGRGSLSVVPFTIRFPDVFLSSPKNVTSFPLERGEFSGRKKKKNAKGPPPAPQNSKGGIHLLRRSHPKGRRGRTVLSAKTPRKGKYPMKKRPSETEKRGVVITPFQEGQHGGILV